MSVFPNVMGPHSSVASHDALIEFRLLLCKVLSEPSLIESALTCIAAREPNPYLLAQQVVQRRLRSGEVQYSAHRFTRTRPKRLVEPVVGRCMLLLQIVDPSASRLH